MSTSIGNTEIRDLTTIDEFRQVVALEQAIWGYTDQGDLVTVPVFIFTVHRGATLIGAFDCTGRMVGFAYAVIGIKAGRPMQWSHMAGVLPEFRGGLGYRLKLVQRERALAQGLDLIEWTFDPLQAMNAHFNFAKLGGIAEEYAANFYGESTSALHRGTPTDRLVLSWKITEPHVMRRLEQPRSRSAIARAARARSVGGADRQLDADRWQLARSHGHQPGARGSPRLDRDSDRFHRHAAARARAGVTVASRSPADVRGVFRERLSRRRLRAPARRRLRTIFAGEGEITDKVTNDNRMAESVVICYSSLLFTQAARRVNGRRARAGGCGTPFVPPARCS